MDCMKRSGRRKRERDLRETMRERSNDETRDKNVNGYNCCSGGCGEDVWCLARVNCTRRARGGKDSRGRRRVTRIRGSIVQGGGRDTWRAGRFRRVVSRISAFIRVVSSSFRRWFSRLVSAADSPAVASLPLWSAFFRNFTTYARRRAPTNRIKVRFKHFWKSTAKRSSYVVSRNREIIDLLFAFLY